MGCPDQRTIDDVLDASLGFPVRLMSTSLSHELSPCAARVTCSPGMSVVIAPRSCQRPEHRLRVKREATFFWEVARGPLDSEDIKISKHSPSLPGTDASDHSVQVHLPFSCGCARGRQFDVGKRRCPCLATALFARGPSCHFVPTSLPTRRVLPALAPFLWDVCFCPSFLESELWSTTSYVLPCPPQLLQPAPSTSPFIALLMDPLPVEAQARFL